MFKDFAPLDIRTKPIYDRHMSHVCFPIPSTFYFQSLYAWNFSSINATAVFEDYLCILAHDTWSGRYYSFPPIGPYSVESFERAVGFLLDRFRNEGLELVFTNVNAYMLPWFEKLKKYAAKISFDSINSDYIYRLGDFENSVRKKNSRQAIRHFKNNNDYRVEAVGSGNKRQINYIAEAYWCSSHTCEDCKYGCEKKVIANLVDQFEDLDIFGFIVSISSLPVAYKLMCRKGSTLICISKRNSHEFRGISNFLHEFTLENYCEGIEYINYTEDMGNAGLATFKSRIAPYSLAHKYDVAISDK